MQWSSVYKDSMQSQSSKKANDSKSHLYFIMTDNILKMKSDAEHKLKVLSLLEIKAGKYVIK